MDADSEVGEKSKGMNEASLNLRTFMIEATSRKNGNLALLVEIGVMMEGVYAGGFPDCFYELHPPDFAFLVALMMICVPRQECYFSVQVGCVMCGSWRHLRVVLLVRTNNVLTFERQKISSHIL